jgi:hypothetical protein
VTVYRVLHKLLTVFESEHLRRLFLLTQVFMLLKLMRHLCVHFGAFIIFMLTEMVLCAVKSLLMVFCEALIEPVCCGVRPLDSIRPLGSVGGVPQRLPLFNPLVYHHVLLLLWLSKLVEILLLLVESRASHVWCSLNLSILNGPLVLVLTISVSLRLISRLESVVVSVKGMQGVEDARVPISF